MYCRHHVVSLTSKLGPTFIQTNRSISIASIPLVPDDDQALSPAENYEESKAQLDSVKTFSGNSGRQSNYSGYSGFERSLTRHGWLRERERERECPAEGRSINMQEGSRSEQSLAHSLLQPFTAHYS